MPSQSDTTSMGLGIMQERAASINAQLRINTQPNQGTQVLVTWTNPQGKDHQ